MFCKKCGAVVTGNYCCVCGERIRSEVDEFRLAERRKRAAFKNTLGILPMAGRIASACWDAASLKYDLCGCSNGGLLCCDAYERLQKVDTLARKLFIRLREELIADGPGMGRLGNRI